MPSTLTPTGAAQAIHGTLVCSLFRVYLEGPENLASMLMMDDLDYYLGYRRY